MEFIGDSRESSPATLCGDSREHSPVNTQATIDAIDLTGDDDVAELLGDQKTRRRLPTENDVLIDLENLELEVPESNDDEGEELPMFEVGKDLNISTQRNGSVEWPHHKINKYSQNGMCYRVGGLVELVDGKFLMIKYIIHNSITEDVSVRGHLVIRTKDLDGLLEKKLNECVLCFDVDLDDLRDMQDQSLIEVSVESILRPREVRLTNRKFPQWRAIKNGFTSQEALELFLKGGLTIRWVYIRYFKTSQDRNASKDKSIEKVLRRVSPTEASQNFSLPEHSLRQMWRGDTNLDDSHLLQKSGQVLSGSSLNNHSRRPSGQKYTFGDAFCGAGGASRGAQMAGLEIVWGFDFDEAASQAWERNFSGASCSCLSADEFYAVWKVLPDEVKVDILHLSPPCQYFSPAHTRPGRDDEMNSGSLFSVAPLIKLCKPRIVTLEQTYGLARLDKCRSYLHALIQMFSSLNFSLRWAIVPLVEWGLAQTRYRLIIIAACPGEVLPRIPAATHSANGEGGLKPFHTINNAIAGLHKRNDPHVRYFADGKTKMPYDGNNQCNTITCSGGETYHPSGLRPFSVPEFAALQGFPTHHLFTGSTARQTRQIGNAVPPVIAKVLYESIIKELEEADGIRNDGSIYIG